MVGMLVNLAVFLGDGAVSSLQAASGFLTGVKDLHHVRQCLLPRQGRELCRIIVITRSPNNLYGRATR